MSHLPPHSRISLSALLTCALALVGCGPAGTGTLSVVVSGEEGAERGFPSTELVDGWSVGFERYLVSIGDVVLTDDGGEVVRALETPTVVDLHRGSATIATLRDVPAGRLGFNFSVTPPTADAVVGAGVSEADVAEMREKGLTYLLVGTATKPPHAPVRFRLGLAAPVRLSDCTNGVDGTQGVVIPASSTTEAELTFHVEHLLYDRLGTHSGVKLRFEAIAAMADESGLVTLEQLAAQPVLSPVGMDGAPLTDADGSPVIYDPGASSVQSLDGFLVRTVRDQAHLNGGGLCTLGLP